MRLLRLVNLPLLLLAILLLPACASLPVDSPYPVVSDRQRIAQLNRDILALGDDIDPREARLAATVAVLHSRELAQQYRVSSSAIAHNLKVNLGIRERGLCIHWTEDLLARLKQDHFQTLDLHWAIANYENAFRLEHSTVVISARGGTIYQGLVLDPWRNTGELYWSPTLADSGYPWQPYDEVMALKRIDQAAIEDRQVLR